MGRSIDLYSYDYEKLKSKILNFCKTDNEEMVEKILLTCGNKIADRYILLNQELWDDCSCYYNIASALEKVFNVDDVFGNVFCAYSNEVADRQELISSIADYELLEILGIEEEDK